MSTLSLSDYSTATTYGWDVASAASTLRELTTDREPLRSFDVDEAPTPARTTTGRVPASREVVEYAATPRVLEDAPHDDGDLGKGKPPRVSGKTLTALKNLGEGWLVWDTTDGKATTYPMREDLVAESTDPAIVPLKTVGEVRAALAKAGGHAPTAAEVLMAEWARAHASGQL